MSTIELAVRIRSKHQIKFFDTYGCSESYINALKENEIDIEFISDSTSPFIVRKYKYKILNSFRYFVFFFKWYKLRLNTRKILAKFQPDIVIVYDERCLSYLSGYKNKYFKTLFYARGWFTPFQITFKTKLLLKYYVDSIICISEATRHAIYCGGIASLKNLFVVHNSINIEKLNSAKGSTIKFNNNFNILHSGAFIPSKGQHIALEAAKILKDRQIDFHLVLCGLIYPGFGNKSKKYFEDLNRYVKEHNLETSVSFIVDKTNIIPYIKSCDIMFFPSGSEGLPRSVLEAMALGKPVIANAVGGVTDLILDGYTGFIAKHDNPLDFADIAQLLIKDINLYNDISTNSLNLIKASYNEDLQIEKMNDIIESKMNY